MPKEGKNSSNGNSTDTTTATPTGKGRTQTAERKSRKGGKPEERKVLYPELTQDIRKEGFPKGPLTEDDAGELLKWEEEPEGARWGDVQGKDYLLKDEYGKKVRCHNNARNRPYTDSWARSLAQDILHSGPGLTREHRRWQFNGENVIIGRTGIVESAQHRLIGLKLACQMWRKNKAHWGDIWPTAPTLETSIIYGLDEEEYVLRTLDNTRPRTYADVLFTSDHFANISPDKRQAVCRACHYAVKTVWERTGMGKVATSAKQTNNELLDFLSRHERIKRAVKAVMEFDSDKDGKDKGRISSRIGLGYAAGLLYLFAASDNDNSLDYFEADPRTEKNINWGKKVPGSTAGANWERAVEFWQRFADKDDPQLEPLRKVIKGFSIKAGLDDVKAAVVKAWNLFKDGDTLTVKNCYPKYEVDKVTKEEELVVHPDCGGIDKGKPKKGDTGTTGADPHTVYNPTPEQIAEEAQEMKDNSLFDDAFGDDGPEEGDGEGESFDPDEPAPAPKRGRGKAVKAGPVDD